MNPIHLHNQNFDVPSLSLFSGSEQCRDIICKDLGYRGLFFFFPQWLSFPIGSTACARSLHTERRHRTVRQEERRTAQGSAPLWLSRSSSESGKKLWDALSVLCGTLTTEITKARVMWCVVWVTRMQRHEAGVKARCSSSGGLQSHKGLPGAALGAGTYSREEVGWLVLRWTNYLGVF